MTPERIQNNAFHEMLEALVDVLDLRSAYWPPLVEVRPPARSDLSEAV